MGWRPKLGIMRPRPAFPSMPLPERGPILPLPWSGPLPGPLPLPPTGPSCGPLPGGVAAEAGEGLPCCCLPMADVEITALPSFPLTTELSGGRAAAPAAFSSARPSSCRAKEDPFLTAHDGNSCTFLSVNSSYG